MGMGMDRWFNHVIQPKKILDKDGNEIRSGAIVPNAFWAKKDHNKIEIKPLSSKYPKARRKPE